MATVSTLYARLCRGENVANTVNETSGELLQSIYYMQ